MTARLQRVVLASGNAGKQREFRALFAPLGIEVLLQREFGIESCEESGETFEANALLKARHAAAGSGLAALADDSGIEVDALQGRPGVRSARYSGEGASDAQNNARMLLELDGVDAASRGARYVCVIAFVRDEQDPTPVMARGEWVGRIALAPSGTGGFGYDPLFIPGGEALSAAQMSAAAKNAVSHRALALQRLLAQLR